MHYITLGFMLVCLLTFASCQRKYSAVRSIAAIELAGSNTELVKAYFTKALNKAHYPAKVKANALSAINGVWKNARKSTITPLIDYYTYFGTALSPAKTAVDSVYCLGKSVYACSNYGWLPAKISDNEFTSLSSSRQYYAMQYNQYSGRCAAFSDFLVKTYAQFGYPAALIKLAVKSSNGDEYTHIAVVVKAGHKWYLVESTTGQMLLSATGKFIDYSTYLKAVEDSTLHTIQTTAATYGRFMQPGTTYTKPMQWIYGSSESAPALLKHTSEYTVLQVKRKLSTWANEEMVKHTYNSCLHEKYGQPNWLYMYYSDNIILVKGDDNAVQDFRRLYIKP